MRIHDMKAGITLACGLSLAVIGASMPTTAQAAGATQNGLIPPLMLPYGDAWAGGGDPGDGLNQPADFFLPPGWLSDPKNIQEAKAHGVRPDQIPMWIQLRAAGMTFIPPAGGIGEIIDGPEHPWQANNMERHHIEILDKNTGKYVVEDTSQTSDLTTEAAKNAKPWVIEALKKQNALVAAGKNVEPPASRCLELGVPEFNETRGPLYIIQTPTEIVMYEREYVRHIYMNVPHSKHLKPTWYGESVGHYEGDTLVVDTIGENDKTLIDGYRTPHTTQIHVIERFRVVSSGRGMMTSITVDDPGAFYKPFGMRKPRWFLANHPLQDFDRICAAGNEDHLNLDLYPVPKALKPDF